MTNNRKRTRINNIAENEGSHALRSIFGNERIIEQLQHMIYRELYFSMIFTGPPGVGKTMAKKALIWHVQSMYGQDAVLELNASDNRNAWDIANLLRPFLQKQQTLSSLSLSSITTMKMIVLEEADGLTPDAQLVLAAILKDTDPKARIVCLLLCNELHELLRPLQSHFLLMEFHALSSAHIGELVLHTTYGSSVFARLSPEDKVVVEVSNGDARMALQLCNQKQIMQSLGFSCQTFEKVLGISDFRKWLVQLTNLFLDSSSSSSSSLSSILILINDMFEKGYNTADVCELCTAFLFRLHDHAPKHDEATVYQCLQLVYATVDKCLRFHLQTRLQAHALVSGIWVLFQT